MDIVDIQCSRGGSHTSQEILAQERGLQRGKTAFEKRDILRGMSTSMMIIIQRTLIKMFDISLDILMRTCISLDYSS